MGLLLPLYLGLVFHAVYGLLEVPEIKTSYGWIQGNYTVTRGGRKIVEFLGIKYAKEPTGTLRFKNPEPPEPWNGVRPATRQCDACMQNMVLLEALRDKVTGSEDCLCLNVFTPEVSPQRKLPVIVFIHGGAYMGFSSNKSDYGPELFLDKDVLLVTMNYRVGVLGFLSTEDEIIPGNFGMKDQVAALRWVRENIAEFGGDPSSITLMGESSGASSVQLHMLSPLSKGLFHKGIAHSGSALNPWALVAPGILKGRAKTLASYIGCPTSPSAAFLSCLQCTPAEKIVATTKKYLVWDADPIVIWGPVIEHKDVQDAFLTKDPRQLTSNLPLLTGFNYAEGGGKTLGLTSGDVEEKFRLWNDRFEELTAMSLVYEHTAPDPASVTAALRKFYFGCAKEITPEMYTKITELYGDIWFTNGVLDGIELHKGVTFLFNLDYNNTAKFSLFAASNNNPLYLVSALCY